MLSEEKNTCRLQIRSNPCTERRPTCRTTQLQFTFARPYRKERRRPIYKFS